MSVATRERKAEMLEGGPGRWKMAVVEVVGGGTHLHQIGCAVEEDGRRLRRPGRAAAAGGGALWRGLRHLVRAGEEQGGDGADDNGHLGRVVGV